jgi:hypothetical protein
MASIGPARISGRTVTQPGTDGYTSRVQRAGPGLRTTQFRKLLLGLRPAGRGSCHLLGGSFDALALHVRVALEHRFLFGEPLRKRIDHSLVAGLVGHRKIEWAGAKGILHGGKAERIRVVRPILGGVSVSVVGAQHEAGRSQNEGVGRSPEEPCRPNRGVVSLCLRDSRPSTCAIGLSMYERRSKMMTMLKTAPPVFGFMMIRARCKIVV